MRVVGVMKHVVLIIGTGGIAAACARSYAASGHAVVLAGRSLTKAESIVRDLNAAGGDAYAFRCDVTDPESTTLLADTVQRELGRIDVLVNAFGVGMIQPFPDIDPKAVRRVMEVNVNGTIFATQAVLRHMLAQKSGNIVMIPGILGKHVMRHSSIYSASKFAVTGFAKALVEEHRRNGIRVSLLYLGGVATPFWDNPDVQMKVQSDKMLTAEEIADAVRFACDRPGTSVLNEIVLQPESHQLI